MRAKCATIKERYESAVRQFWILAYRQAQKRLPEGYHDEIWTTFLRERLEELRNYIPDEMILVLVEDIDAGVEGSNNREWRLVGREIRDAR